MTGSPSEEEAVLGSEAELGVDGESNWVEGLQLMSVYLILALAFYFVPAPR